MALVTKKIIMTHRRHNKRREFIFLNGALNAAIETPLLGANSHSAWMPDSGRDSRAQRGGGGVARIADTTRPPIRIPGRHIGPGGSACERRATRVSKGEGSRDSIASTRCCRASSLRSAPFRPDDGHSIISLSVGRLCLRAAQSHSLSQCRSRLVINLHSGRSISFHPMSMQISMKLCSACLMVFFEPTRAR